jgi:uncharacterized protein YndB with AHSA1/START domain
MIAPQGTWEHTGEYLVVDRPHKLSFTWFSLGTNKTRSVVTLDLEAAGDGETDLRLTHADLPDAVAATEHTQGWSEILDQLEKQFGRAG